MKTVAEKLFPEIHKTKQTFRRTIVKTITYRVFVLICDFVAVYLFTGKVKVALGFMIVSNTYATVGYYFHERIWHKIKWGKIGYKKNQVKATIK